MLKMYLTPKNIILGAIQALQVAATIMFMIAIININMLPALHIILISVILGILFIVTAFVQTRQSWKRYIGTGVSILLSAGLIFGSIAANNAKNTMHEITAPSQYVDKVVIAVRADSDIETIWDIKDKPVGTQYNQQGELMLATEGKLHIEQNIEFDTIQCNTVIEQVIRLFDEEVDAIIYNSAYGDLFVEQMPDFNSKIKIIFTCDMTEEDIEKYKDVIDLTAKPGYAPPPEETPEDEEYFEPATPDDPYPQNEDVFSVYMSGIDVYGSITTNSRSDVNIIAIVNPKENKILLVTTPRDCFVPIPGVSGGKLDKLTHAGIYGIDASMATLSNLYNVELDYYVRVNFTSFETIVDALGGISVYSAYNFNAGGYNYVKGYNDLNGKEALVFVRERYSFAAGDNQRGKNQQEAIKAIIKKACSPAILTAANDILDSVRDNIDMNVPEEFIQSLIKKQLSDGKEWEIVTMAATGTGSQDEPFSMPGLTAYVMIPNQDSINEIRDAIADMYK